MCCRWREPPDLVATEQGRRPTHLNNGQLQTKAAHFGTFQGEYLRLHERRLFPVAYAAGRDVPASGLK